MAPSPAELASFTPIRYGILIPCLLWSWWQLGLMHGGPSVSSCSAVEGPKPWAQSPPFPHRAGSLSHPCPRQGLLSWLHPSSLGATLFLRPSRFPDRGHCSQHCLMGAAAPNPPALPQCGLRSLVLTTRRLSLVVSTETGQERGCSQGTTSQLCFSRHCSVTKAKPTLGSPSGKQRCCYYQSSCLQLVLLLQLQYSCSCFMMDPRVTAPSPAVLRCCNCQALEDPREGEAFTLTPSLSV